MKYSSCSYLSNVFIFHNGYSVNFIENFRFFSKCVLISLDNFTQSCFFVEIIFLFAPQENLYIFEIKNEILNKYYIV